MSQVLYALVILQGSSSGLTFSPGYTTAAECLQQYKGPNVACFNYDPEGTSWTAFFKLPDGGFRVVRRIPSEGECRRYIDAFRSDIPAACRQLAQPDTCNVACIKPLEPPPKTDTRRVAAAKSNSPHQRQNLCRRRQSLTRSPTQQALTPNPATFRSAASYTKVTGLTWIDKEPLPDSFADVSVGPNDLHSKDKPSLPR